MVDRCMYIFSARRKISQHVNIVILRTNEIAISPIVYNMFCRYAVNTYNTIHFDTVNKCLALIVQLVKAFCMNPKFGDSSPPQVETFTVSKTSTISLEHRVENECCCSRTVNIPNFSFI